MRRYYPLIPDALTICSVAISVIATVALPYLSKYMILRVIVMTATIDAFDGKLARKFKNPEKVKVGKILDASADFINFGIFPCIVIYRSLGIMVSVLHISCVFYRLLRFYHSSIDNNSVTYVGVPCPFGAIISLAGLLISNGLLISAILSCGLMVSKFPTIVLHRLKPRNAAVFYGLSFASIILALCFEHFLLFIVATYLLHIPFTRRIQSFFINKVAIK